MAKSERAPYYYRARYYDPQVGRFLSEDPIAFAGGQADFYGYVGGNPISYGDPSGECPWCIGAAIGLGTDLVLQLAANGGNFHCINLKRLAVSTALGALGGGLGGKGLTTALSGLSNGAKGALGEGMSIMENRLLGSTLLDTQTSSIPGFSTVVDSTWQSFRGSIYYVESKFGTSTLTSAQRLAGKALGDAYHVERWPYPFFGRLGGYAGGTVGGLLGSHTSGSGCDGCK